MIHNIAGYAMMDCLGLRLDIATCLRGNVPLAEHLKDLHA